MNAQFAISSQESVSGPHLFENLAVYLVHGPDRCDRDRFESLGDALACRTAIVHETGTVGALEIENLSARKDLLVLAGEVVKGGRQDRTLGVDLVVPARSPRVIIPAFCVEQRRWSRRRGEDDRSFSGSSSMLAKDLLLQAKLAKSQAGVWKAVEESHARLSASLEGDVASALSPSSYQLMTENARIRARQAEFGGRLGGLLEAHADAIGYVFVIHGRPSTADVFASNRLARSFFAKLLDAAILAALSERSSPYREGRVPGPEEVGGWLNAVAAGDLVATEDIRPRLLVEQRRCLGNRAAYFGSLDQELGVYVHRNWATL